jgi:hypothetical protein
MDKLIWVQTTWDTEEPRTHVMWPALKYLTLDDLLKTDKLVRDNALLKQKILASNHHKRVLGNPIARLLGPPPGQVVVEWLTPSNYNGKAFFDDFVALSRQFISLPETSKIRIRFDQALTEAFTYVEALIHQSPVDVPLPSQSTDSSNLQSIRKVLNFGSTSMTSSITCHDEFLSAHETTPKNAPAIVEKENLNHHPSPPSPPSPRFEETFKFDEVVQKKSRQAFPLWPHLSGMRCLCKLLVTTTRQERCCHFFSEGYCPRMFASSKAISPR